MEHPEKIKEIVLAFPYWPQAAFLIGGMVLFCVLHVVRRKLRTRHYNVDNGRRSMVVIESRSRKNGKKGDVNTQYFAFIKNAQYSTEDTPS